MSSQIVITGLGVVSPIGIGWESHWSALLAGTSGVGVRAEYEHADLPYEIGGQVKDFNAKDFVKQRKSIKVMCREIQFGYAAAVMAMEQAGLTTDALDPDRVGVVMGSELLYCDIAEVEAAYRAAQVEGSFEFKEWCQRAMSDLNPLWMLKHLPNMAACHIGIGHDARGHNNSITLGDVSSLLAIAEGASIIERGWCDVMMVGGLGARSNLTHMTYKGAKDLSSRIAEPEKASRPFDRDRDGAVIGEGAAVFVLESQEHAEARGAKVLSRYLGSSSGFGDPKNGSFGGAIEGAITNALRSAEITADDVSHINANGLSTVREDRIEAQAIRAALGDTPVLAAKSFYGNLGAGTGAVESLASILSLIHGQVPATLNYEHADPECPVNVIHGEPMKTDAPAAITVNQSLTGQTVAMVFGRP